MLTSLLVASNDDAIMISGLATQRSVKMFVIWMKAPNLIKSCNEQDAVLSYVSSRTFFFFFFPGRCSLYTLSGVFLLLFVALLIPWVFFVVVVVLFFWSLLSLYPEWGVFVVVVRCSRNTLRFLLLLLFFCRCSLYTLSGVSAGSPSRGADVMVYALDVK